VKPQRVHTGEAHLDGVGRGGRTHFQQLGRVRCHLADASTERARFATDFAFGAVAAAIILASLRDDGVDPSAIHEHSVPSVDRFAAVSSSLTPLAIRSIAEGPYADSGSRPPRCALLGCA
jgi:hypothetical protein